MTEIEIATGNKLIAEFMGYSVIKLKCHPFGSIPQWVTYLGESTPLYAILQNRQAYSNHLELKFHSSWDWLMPVVEKIESLAHITSEGDWGKYHISINRYSASVCYGRFRIGDLNSCKTKIEATWFTIVEFITWYNLKK